MPSTLTGPWIISTGTLRPCDLAAAYLSALNCLDAVARLGEYDQAELAQLANHANDCIGPEPNDCGWLALEAAEILLGELAPEGFYFGGHEGDPACIGFHAIESDDF